MSSVYKTYSADKLEELLSNFLVSSWSYSKVAQFARNEKAFEMIYVFGQGSKTSATTVAGQAYHHALDRFFFALKNDGDKLDLAMLEKFAFEYIDEKPAFIWKTQKTTPTIEECKIKATKTVTALLRNFYGEMSVYLDDIAEVMEVEVYCDEFVTINGVDIPLPCHAKVDLVVRTKHGKVVIIDHKSKQSFTDEAELRLSIGVQAITYIKCFESKTGIHADEVWFVENKFSTNKDGSKQLNAFKLKLDENVRRLYETLIYEPLRRMVSAVNDPDYVYLINESDNFIDKAELYEFWAKTMIAEVEEFNVDPKKRSLVEKRLRKIRDVSLAGINPKIIKNFKENAAEFIQYDLSNKNMTNAEKIEHVLRSFGIISQVAHQFEGYSSNTYLLEVQAGVKIASIHKHKLDIANQLNVSSVRLSKDLQVYDGKSYLAVEFTKKRDKDLIFEPGDLEGMRIPVGKDNLGNTIVWDLNNHSTPHMLVCGATGSGKSVSIKSIIEYAKLAGVNDIYIMDPKFEFTAYNSDGKVSVFNDILDIENALADLVKDMNERVKTGQSRKTLIVFDEFADAVSAARSGNALKVFEEVEIGNYANGNPRMAMKHTDTLLSLEENLKVLLQKGRSSGFRIISATQRASVKVITGDAKVNFPVQICFRVPKEADSRVVLDEAGAESLAGRGDGLIKSPEYEDTVRFQAYYKP